MVNNPFRSKPSTTVPNNIEDWGKTKFKPRIGGNDKFKIYNRKFNNRKGSFHEKKEKYKFNEVARDAKPDNATPWNKYKDEIIYKQREEEQATRQANMDSNEVKILLKQRELNYRKSLIQQKTQEPIEWENFDEEEKSGLNEIKVVKSEIGKAANKNKSTSFNKNRNKSDNKLNTQSKAKFKKCTPNAEFKPCTEEFISKELLDNFDSKKLNYEQNDKLRGAITKTTIMASGCSLAKVVQDMKRKAIRKEKLNKIY